MGTFDESDLMKRVKINSNWTEECRLQSLRDASESKSKRKVNRQIKGQWTGMEWWGSPELKQGQKNFERGSTLFVQFFLNMGSF